MTDHCEVRRDAERMRSQGLSWRSIGRELDIDARRVQRIVEPQTGRRYSEAARRWRDRHPAKAKAHVPVWDALRTALRNGSVIRPGSCEDCGIACVPHGHHDDYAKPLDVRWLCAKCHAAVHRVAA